MIAGMFDNRRGAAAVAAVAVAGFVIINLVASSLSGARVDLTQDKLFTLSKGTRNILKSLSKPMTLTLYYSRQLGEVAPPYGLHSARVRDLLNEFADASNGNLIFVERDPEPYSELEDKVVSAGLQGVPVDESGEKVYFGLVGEIGGTSAVMPILQPDRDRFLEYDLIRLVSKLQNPKKPLVGVWTRAPMFGDFRAQMQGLPTKEWAIIEQLRERFDVTQIFLANQIKDEFDVLVLAHAARLDDEGLYAVDQYLMRGGKALIFVDPYNEGAGSQRFTVGAVPESSNLKRLFDKWGVAVDGKKVAGDIKLARLVNAGSADQLIPAPYVTWLSLKRANISTKDLVTANLQAVNMASSGAVTVKEKAAVSLEPLIWTTKASQMIDVKHISKNPPDIQGMVERFKPSDKRRILAARLSGVVETAFPKGPPEDRKAALEKPAKKKPAKKKTDPKKKVDPKKKPVAKAKKTDPKAGTDTGAKAKAKPAKKAKAKTAPEKPKWKPHVAKSRAPLNVILVADSDMLSNSFWVQTREFFGRRFKVPFANNGDFVLNSLENLSGSSDLISLRSRGSARRPFTRVRDMRLAAQQKFKSKEQGLIRQLGALEKKLVALQGKAGGPPKKLSTAQQAEVGKFTDELLATRKSLRQVRLELRKDIDALRNWLSFANVGLVPLGVAILAIGLGWVRIRRRKLAAAG